MAEAADDLEQLKQQKERLELKAQIMTLTAPWWRKASLVATVTALVAAILPVKTAIEEHYGNEREFVLQQVRQQSDIAMQQARQEHEIRLAYLDRFEVPGHRLQTLRFLLATTTDARLIAWAKAEQQIVQAEVDAIVRELQVIAAKIEQAPPGKELEELKQLHAELKKLYSVTTLRPTQKTDAAEK
jgi:hypothetical protein